MAVPWAQVLRLLERSLAKSDIIEKKVDLVVLKVDEVVKRVEDVERRVGAIEDLIRIRDTQHVRAAEGRIDEECKQMMQLQEAQVSNDDRSDFHDGAFFNEAELHNQDFEQEDWKPDINRTRDCESNEVDNVLEGPIAREHAALHANAGESVNQQQLNHRADQDVLQFATMRRLDTCEPMIDTNGSGLVVSSSEAEEQTIRIVKKSNQPAESAFDGSGTSGTSHWITLVKYNCDQCSFVTSERNDMKAHKLVHAGEDFICRVCNKKFSDKGPLSVHMKAVHLGIKPFSCTVCGKAFSRKTTLLNHMLSHSGEKPFSCVVCKKKFRQRIHLTTHMRGHTGEKPYSCSLCNQKFSHKGTLKYHIVQKHSEGLPL